MCRFQLNEEFEIVFGGTEAWRACLVTIQKKSAQVQILSTRKLPEIKPPFVNLAVGVTKWSTFEEIIEKSVELGVSRLQPLITDFSFIRSLKDWPESRTERFRKIIKSATEQCGRGPLMKIENPLLLRDFVKDINPQVGDLGLFAYEGPAQRSLRVELKDQHRHQPQNIWGVIGPTGGFSHNEVELMKTRGYPPLTLGNQILRADTACFAMISVIKYEFGLMEGESNG